MSSQQSYVPSTIVYNREDGSKNVFICHEKLGHGGFAAVYKVTIENTNKAYAMKVISKERNENSNGKKSLEKLKNEIKIQKNLIHPNIVQSKISFSDEFNYYIALEYCPGKSIREYLRSSENGRLSEPEARKILNDVLEGLIFLHNHQIIHHDLKLENFLIGSDGNVKIGDFGLATIYKSDEDKKYPFCGTTNYLSPEMILKKSKGISFESDIWAIGVSAFIMLTGKPPFDGGDKERTYQKIKNCDYTFPSKIQISAEAKDFIKTILRIDPSKRPIAIDIIDHPFLTKLDKEKVQLYKPVQKVPKFNPSQTIQKVQQIPKCPANQNNAFIQTKFCSKSRNLAPIPPKSSIYNFERKSSNVKNDDANVDIFHKIVLCDYENNEIKNEMNSVIKKSFILPKHFIAKHFIHDGDLGYIMSNGCVGVCFSDKSRIIMDPREEFAQFYRYSNSNGEVIRLEDYFQENPGCNNFSAIKNKYQDKVSLLKKFSRAFKKYISLYDMQNGAFDSSIPLHNVKHYIQKDQTTLFKFSDNNVQVNFKDCRKLIIFWNLRKMCIVRNLKDNCDLLDLNDIASSNNNCEEHKKLRRAKELLLVLAKRNAE